MNAGGMVMRCVHLKARDARGCREQLNLEISRHQFFFLFNKFLSCCCNPASGARNLFDAPRPDVCVDERWTRGLFGEWVMVLMCGPGDESPSERAFH